MDDLIAIGVIIGFTLLFCVLPLLWYFMDNENEKKLNRMYCLFLCCCSLGIFVFVVLLGSTGN